METGSFMDSVFFFFARESNMVPNENPAYQAGRYDILESTGSP